MHSFITLRAQRMCENTTDATATASCRLGAKLFGKELFFKNLDEASLEAPIAAWTRGASSEAPEGGIGWPLADDFKSESADEQSSATEWCQRTCDAYTTLGRAVALLQTSVEHCHAGCALTGTEFQLDASFEAAAAAEAANGSGGLPYWPMNIDRDGGVCARFCARVFSQLTGRRRCAAACAWIDGAEDGMAPDASYEAACTRGVRHLAPRVDADDGDGEGEGYNLFTGTLDGGAATATFTVEEAVACAFRSGRNFELMCK
jgi:hypothetical protein